MKPYSELTREELLELKKDLSAQYHAFQGKDLKLDMSRGKPSDISSFKIFPLK